MLFGEYNRLERYEEHNPDGDLTLVVSTIEADDTDHPYETAVSHIDLNPGKWAIVEEYDDYESAVAGHGKWIGIMTADNLPERLEDKSSCQLVKTKGTLEVEQSEQWWC